MGVADGALSVAPHRTRPCLPPPCPLLAPSPPLPALSSLPPGGTRGRLLRPWRGPNVRCVSWAAAQAARSHAHARQAAHSAFVRWCSARLRLAHLACDRAILQHEAWIGLALPWPSRTLTRGQAQGEGDEAGWGGEACAGASAAAFGGAGPFDALATAHQLLPTSRSWHCDLHTPRLASASACCWRKHGTTHGRNAPCRLDCARTRRNAPTARN